MKLRHIFIFALLFIFSHAVFATSSDCAVNNLLKIGSRGTEVECLQEKIGISIDGKFGPMTRTAVMAFQSDHGLVADGIVGSMTRMAINSPTLNATAYPTGCVSSVGYSSVTGVKCDVDLNPPVAKKNNDSKTSSPISPKVEANLVNMDKFIEDVVAVSRRQGKTDKELTLITETLKNEIAKSDIDYKKKFEELLVNESKLSASLKNKSSVSVFDKIIGKTLAFFGINPPIAQAQAAPFGGAVLFALYCGYSQTWMIDITPLLPTEVMVLSYIPGTQGFASYNIPLTSWLLGTYTAPGICILPGTPLTYIPTEGFINPMVGSSPL